MTGTAPAAGSTPLTLTVGVKTSNCSLFGTCSTSFTITNNNAASDHPTVSVNWDTGTGGGGGGGGGTSLMSYSPSPFSLTTAAGGTATNNIIVSTSSATAFNVSFTQNPAGTYSPGTYSWLFISQSSNTLVTGSPITIYVQATAPTGVDNTTLNGSITLTPNNGGQALSIPVSLIIGTGGSGGGVTGTMFTSPASPLSFSYPYGTTGQSVYVGTSNSTTAPSFTAQAYSAGGWLLVNGVYSLSSQSINTNIYVSVNSSIANSLGTGFFTGTVTLVNTANVNDTLTLQVNLSTNGATGGGGSTTGSISPSTVNFSWEQNRQLPACQNLLVPYAGAFTVTTTGSPQFAYVSVTEMTGPGTVQVCANPGGLTQGSYQNAISFYSQSLAISQTVLVNVTVYATPVVKAAINNAFGTLTCFFNTGGACNDSTLDVSMSDFSAQTVNVAASQSWVQITPATTGTTPTSFNVHLVPQNLANGVNTATITVTSSGSANGSAVIPVTVQVNGGTGTGGGSGTGSSGLTANPTSLAFTFNGQQQNLQVTATSGGSTSFTAGVGNCSWMYISQQSSSTTPSTITAQVAGGGLTAGQTYNCNVVLTTSTGTLNVPVTFTPTSGPTGNVTVDKTGLNFTAIVGSNPSPASQTLTVSSSSGAVAFNATSNQTWLTVSPTAGTAGSSTTGTLTVTINSASLTANTYNGQITITPNGGTAVNVPVTLTVAPQNSVSVTTTTLTFSYIAGNPNPAAQQIQINGVGQTPTFSATVTSGSDWLSVSQATGTAPATIEARVNPSALNPGDYTGTIVVAGSGVATGSSTITVNLKVTAPLPTINTVANAASGATGAISAGEIITLSGIAMGPSTGVAAPSNANPFPTTLGGVTVTVGGYPAPLLYASGAQINAVVPYEINRPFLANPTVIVRYLGQSSNGVTVSQTGTVPGIFTANGSGSGQAAALNGNLSVNAPGNPVNKGDAVVLYLTGEGVVSPAASTGRVTATAGPYPQPLSGLVTVTIDGQPANVEFYGAAPGLIAGVMQVNVRVPATVGSGAVPVVVRVGNTSSQTDARGVGLATVSVR